LDVRSTDKRIISDCPQTPAKPVNFPGFTPQAQGIINAFAGGAGTPQSEDCLTLNIWAPLRGKKARKQKEKQPVLVFFHGGRESSRPSASSPPLLTADTQHRLHNRQRPLILLQRQPLRRSHRRHHRHLNLPPRRLRLPRRTKQYPELGSPRPTASRRMGPREYRCFRRRCRQSDYLWSVVWWCRGGLVDVCV
jgi:hypothetical protein